MIHTDEAYPDDIISIFLFLPGWFSCGLSQPMHYSKRWLHLELWHMAIQFTQIIIHYLFIISHTYARRKKQQDYRIEISRCRNIQTSNEKSAIIISFYPEYVNMQFYGYQLRCLKIFTWTVILKNIHNKNEFTRKSK